MAIRQRGVHGASHLAHIDRASLTGGLPGGSERRRIQSGELHILERRRRIALQRADERSRTGTEAVGRKLQASTAQS